MRTFENRISTEINKNIYYAVGMLWHRGTTRLGQKHILQLLIRVCWIKRSLWCTIFLL